MTTTVPACFAAATVFSNDSDTCKGCRAFMECAQASIETLRAIRHLIDVDDLMIRHKKARNVSQAAIKKADAEAAAAMPPGNVEQKMPIEPVVRATKVERVKFEICASDEAVIATMPGKAQKYGVSLIESGAAKRCRQAVGQGDAALLPSDPQWFSIALTALIGGGFERASLRASFVTAFGWSEATAAAYVSLSLALIPLVATAKEEGGRIVLSPVVAA